MDPRLANGRKKKEREKKNCLRLSGLELDTRSLTIRFFHFVLRRAQIKLQGYPFQEILKGDKYHCTIDLLFYWFGLVSSAKKNKN
jgi:hypothetical protein